MATSPTARNTPHSRPSSISRGATARSASPRISSSLNSAAARRTSLKTAQNNDADTERREQLLVQLQNKDQTITELSTENDNLTSALNTAEARLNELYAEQNRSELEMAQRIDISEKLRDQVRELEKEKRDLQRRYNEQTTTFEAERQALYDNEQHLKSRIQSLTQARKQPPVPVQHSAEEDEPETDPEEQIRPTTPKQDLNDPETEPAEITALKLELSTLATSYSSLQSTLVLLQSQLVDLKRVNREVQEENESYMILLREKTLSGQFNVMKQVGTTPSEEDEDEEMDDDFAEAGSLRSAGRSTLDRVEEEDSLEHELQRSLEPQDTDSASSRSRQRRKRAASSGAPRGESLADLPITGPGLDLAAELGRAENKDILGHTIDERDESAASKGKRFRKDSNKKPSATDGGIESSPDLDALRSEVKALKDANKALSLYASKIIDRIIAQEGFEHVLAADYEKEPATPSTVTATKPPTKARPQSVIVGRSLSNPLGDTRNTTPLTATPKLNSSPSTKTQRRSLSFDWKNFSIFNTEKKPDPNLRPLTLKPGTSTLTSARKLDNQEDEEDRRERERLNATMKLMGIQPAPPSPIVMQKSVSSPGPAPSANNNRRFSFFGAISTTATDNSETSSLSSVNSRGLGSLTQEALEHAEAENSLAALDAHERALSAEISRGSGSGFTEIAPRSQGRRSRRSAGGSGSGSTVWSAGMSGNGEEED